MSFTNELLDKARAIWQCENDAQLAKRLGIKPAAVSNYRQGIRHPQPDTIERMALALGEQPIMWALRIQAERDAKKNPANSKVWLRWAETVSKTAASVALTIGLAVYTPNSEAHGSVNNNCASIHYAHIRKWLTRVLGILLGPRQGPDRASIVPA